MKKILLLFCILLLSINCSNVSCYAISKKAATENMVECITNNNPTGVSRMLSMGAKVNVADSKGLTPLHKAIIIGNNDIVKLLINKGAKVNVAEYINGDTPLTLAAKYDNIAAYNMLVNAGADVNAKNDKNQTVLDIARDNKSKQILKTLGYYASGNPKYFELNQSELNKLLLESKTPEELQELIDSGADVNARNDYDFTLLMRICNNPTYYEDPVSMAQILLASGADVGAKKSGFTASYFLVSRYAYLKNPKYNKNKKNNKEIELCLKIMDILNAASAKTTN